jgi:riboflavin kinase/FMN adenylyltransferase
MKVYNSFDDIKFEKNTILTVGTFDGVHKGHQQIIGRLLEIAKQENLRPVIVTIHPHPQVVLRKSGTDALHLLTSIEERLTLFENYGIDHTLVIPFSYEFSLTSPEDFVKQYLINKIGMKKILIGYDHLFGKNREGSQELLQKLSKEYDFEVERLDARKDNDLIISSTAIRQHLQNHRIKEAAALLGYSYHLRGKVVVGDRRGNTIGYPTANVRPNEPNKLMPANGVYLVHAKIKNEIVFGMANIGTRPTFTDDIQPTLEVNFFDFDDDIYGKYITVNFLEFLRKEVKFDSLQALLNQLEEDKKNCQQIIKTLYKYK